MGSRGKGVQTASSVDARSTRFPFPSAANGHLHREKGSLVIDKNTVVTAAVRGLKQPLGSRCVNEIKACKRRARCSEPDTMPLSSPARLLSFLSLLRLAYILLQTLRGNWTSTNSVFQIIPRNISFSPVPAQRFIHSHRVGASYLTSRKFRALFNKRTRVNNTPRTSASNLTREFYLHLTIDNLRNNSFTLPS